MLLPQSGAASAQRPIQTHAAEPKGAEGFVLRTEAAGDWGIAMRFAVFYSATDPRMELRGGAGGVGCNVVSWFNEALDEDSETVQPIAGFASVGGGVDPRILRESVSFRTSGLFQPAPHVALTANAVSQGEDRWSKHLATLHAEGATDDGAAVTFDQGEAYDGTVTVTATITGNTRQGQRPKNC